jgi:2-polyprenyl-3-methyl-5-hydroxy-6-metoxy-1,4-benzoquinol methylase
MNKLTDKEDWDAVFQGMGDESRKPTKNTLGARLVSALDGVFGGRLREWRQDYAGYLMWNVLYPRYLPHTEGLKILEIGSAPGHGLLRFHQEFGYTPYGVEYSEAGVNLNRQLFALNGIDTSNVIHSDAFSEEFISNYRGFFDVVLSRGFIEHFSDVGPAIDMHIALLKDGGYLVVSVPNASGLNYALAAIFNRKRLRMHNRAIMNKRNFTRIFSRSELQQVYGSHFGTFSFSLFSTPPGSPMRFALALCRKLGSCMNVALRLVLGRRGLESQFTSPYLLYIGRKLPSIHG